MGATASKAARKYPKRPQTQTPSWSGARTTDRAEDKIQQVASEHRNDAIEKDAIDPHFLSNLSRIGAVQVDHHMRTVETSANYKRMYDARLQSEYDASSTFSGTTPNRLLATTLTELLDLRKSSATQDEYRKACVQYGVDVKKIDNIARHINTPSEKGGTTFRTVTEDGNEVFTSTAAWIQPASK